MQRRAFLATTFDAAATFGVPRFVPSSAFGNTSPSNRINVGVIGLGNQSTINLLAFLGNDQVQATAVRDVNEGSYGSLTDKQILGRIPGRDKVNVQYAAGKTLGSSRILVWR